MTKKTLVIDARPLSRGYGGIQRYLARILPYLIESKCFNITLYSDKPIEQTYSKLVKGVPSRIGTNSLIKIPWHLAVPFWLRMDEADLFWSPRHHLPIFVPVNTRTIVTIHDFTWKSTPSSMKLLQRNAEKFLMPKAISRADKIITVSQTSSNLLTKYFPGAKGKSRVILHGTDVIENRNFHDKKTKKSQILAVGTIEPRKNYERLISAFEYYTKRGGKLRLHIVGKRGWHYQATFKKISRSSVKHYIQVSESLNDEQLNREYAESTCLISISMDEGYGLPISEAIQFGLPLLLSDIPVYRELFPTATGWANPKSITSIGEMLLRFENKSHNTDSDNSTNSHLWTWRECALEHISLISNLSDK